MHITTMSSVWIFESYVISLLCCLGFTVLRVMVSVLKVVGDAKLQITDWTNYPQQNVSSIWPQYRYGVWLGSLTTGSCNWYDIDMTILFWSHIQGFILLFYYNDYGYTDFKGKFSATPKHWGHFHNRWVCIRDCCKLSTFEGWFL